MDGQKALVEYHLYGTQTDPGGISDSNETQGEGTIYEKNGFMYVVTSSERYKFNHRSLEVVKNGDITTKMYFEAGKNYTTLYDTSFGSFHFTFKTSRYSLTKNGESFIIETDYEIEDRNVRISTNKIKLVIDPKHI